ncbi:MAG TPA: protoporphyrinogen oxidase [Burkholderiaceae bacterium]|nr:protoporphyrinogen oxidase [Burkholderiaceae bacterium]
MGTDVLVIGAGLSGLVTAYRAKRAGLGVAVFEAGSRPGGVIGSERRAGALFERGPNSGLDTTPLINAMLDDLGIRGERVDGSAESSRRYVVRGGRLVALPMSPGAFLRTPLFSFGAKLRLFAEPFIGRASPDVEESIAQFVRRRLGQEFLDYAIEPFVAGIYAGDPAILSVPAAFPRLHALEQQYGGLIKGAILGARQRKKSAEKGKNAASSFSFREGMQTLTDALARAVGHVDCEVKVRRVERRPDGLFTVSGERFGMVFERQARAVVVATPAYAAASIVQSIAPAAAQALSEIPYPPVTVVASAYKRREILHPLDGFGFLAPAKERPAVLGTLFSSTMFENRAPSEIAVLTTFVGGRRNPELATAGDAEVRAAVQSELARLLGAAAEPMWSEITRWARAIPQYTMGHLQRIARAEEAERAAPGLYFCANYRGGVSIGDCVKAGHATAERVASQLQSGRTAAAAA